MPLRTRVVCAAVTATYLLAVVGGGAFHTHGPRLFPVAGCSTAGCHAADDSPRRTTGAAADGGHCHGPGLRSGADVGQGPHGCAACRFIAQHQVTAPASGAVDPPQPLVDSVPVPSAAVRVPVVLVWHSRAPPFGA